MIVLGIDPGYDRLGAAVLSDTDKNRPAVIFSECFETSRKDEHSIRLGNIAKEVAVLLTTYKPDLVAIESLFFSKNQTTAIKVAEARGVVLAACGLVGIPVCEFNPMEIKVAITGYGKSDKSQVTSMVKRLARMDVEKKRVKDDEFDAIAIALTCIATRAHNLARNI